jgi:farnesyl-diphosphate farnesyltransferase
METGMADFTHKAVATGMVYIATVTEYDLYCHYVAGLVGKGLTAIWSASGKEAPWLSKELGLSNSMGLLLQKTNITRDFQTPTKSVSFGQKRSGANTASTT